MTDYPQSQLANDGLPLPECTTIWEPVEVASSFGSTYHTGYIPAGQPANHGYQTHDWVWLPVESLVANHIEMTAEFGEYPYSDDYFFSFPLPSGDTLRIKRPEMDIDVDGTNVHVYLAMGGWVVKGY